MVIPLMLENCKNTCDEEQIATKDYFTDQYNGYFPNNGLETYTFLRNNTDTIQFIGQGISDNFNEVERVSGDCPITYKLLSKTITYKTPNALNSLSFNYFLYSETEDFQEYYQIMLSTPAKVVFGPYLARQSTPFRDLNVLGHTYPYVRTLSNTISKDDTIYVTFSTLVPNPVKRLVRMKIKGDIYEVIPE